MAKVKNEEKVAPKIQRGASHDVAPDAGVPEKVSASSKESDVKPSTAWLKFQTKKVNGVLMTGDDANTNPDVGSKSDAMKQALLAQKTISILIPTDPGSDPKVPFPVNLNGYRLDLPTNTYIDVPEQIAEVIRQSNKQTVDALNQFKAGSKKELE